jgi:WD40 repeat protein
VKSHAPRLQAVARLALDDFPVDAAWSPDGNTLLVGCGEGAVLQCRPAEREAGVTEVGRHANGVLAVAWQPAGMQCASSGQDGEVRMWDSRSANPVSDATGAGPLLREAQWSEHLAFAPNGKQLAVATGKRLRIFDTAGNLRADLPDRSGGIAALAWRPKTLEIAAAANGGMRIHRVADPPYTLDLPWKGACLTASWSPDGRIVASGLQDGSVHFWYVAAGKQSEMKGYGAKVRLTTWSASGRWLATSANEQIVVWDFGGRGPEGGAPLELRSHTARLTQLAFAPQGNLLISGASDRRLLAWQPGASEQPVDADLLADEIVLVRFSRDGTRLAVGDRSGVLTCYRVETRT